MNVPGHDSEADWEGHRFLAVGDYCGLAMRSWENWLLEEGELHLSLVKEVGEYISGLQWKRRCPSLDLFFRCQGGGHGLGDGGLGDLGYMVVGAGSVSTVEIMVMGVVSMRMVSMGMMSMRMVSMGVVCMGWCPWG